MLPSGVNPSISKRRILTDRLTICIGLQEDGSGVDEIVPSFPGEGGRV